MAPSSTIIITGGTGALGSTVARSLETAYPGRFHLVLTCRNTTDARAVAVSEFLKSKDSSFALEELDLSDLSDVKAFAGRIKSRIEAGEIPGLIGGGIVNSAAYMTFVREAKTKDGVDVMYTINCLAPALLARCLLPALIGERSATVINVGSEAHGIGRVEYFEEQKETNKNSKNGEKLGFLEGMKRYGSSKLLCVMMGYGLQRQLYAVSFALVLFLKYGSF
jgi:NAD(P)-dependent dehydrogenase (short-subunit alcohol dehydrogenase family)